MGHLGWHAALALLLVIGASASARERGDLNVAVKGGIGRFTGELDELSDSGPTWGALVNVQPWDVIGLELAYQGSRHDLIDPRLLGSPAVLRHGGDALLKLAPPFLERVKPFLGVGFGASYVTVTGETFGLYRGDTVEEVPFAAGLEFNAGPVTAGVRATYRALLDEEFAPGAPLGAAEGGLLDFGATLGGRF